MGFYNGLLSLANQILLKVETLQSAWAGDFHVSPLTIATRHRYHDRHTLSQLSSYSSMVSEWSSLSLDSSTCVGSVHCVILL